MSSCEYAVVSVSPGIDQGMWMISSQQRMDPMCSPISLQRTLVMPVMLEWSTTALPLMPLEPSAAQLSGLSMQVRGKMGGAL